MFDNDTSDAELLQAFVQGEMRAFDALMMRYRATLFGWLVSMTSNRSDAEDLFQELWIRVMRHAGRFHNVSFKAWVWKIARNLVIDFRRKSRPTISLDAVVDQDDTPLVERMATAEGAPYQGMEFSDISRRVMAAVDELPDMQKEVFLMRVQGELTFKEIASTLDIPLNTALGRMHDAVKKLKRQLSEEES